jgi:pyruvate carboxylase subunit B
MHDRQYRDYKSGVAKTRFLKELEDKKAELTNTTTAKVSQKKLLFAPETGIAFIYSGTTATYRSEDDLDVGEEVKKGEIVMYIMINRTFREVSSDRDGKIKKILVKSGDKVRKGDPLVEFE